ncbi:MAG: hypothetical protein K0S80_5306 [Neobacillus sp.]|nr:hypothetical protein [Neobacillus sp.]
MLLMPDTNEKMDILRNIDYLRDEMIRFGLEEGLSSKNTIMISQILDVYIVKYQSIQRCEG